MYRRGLKTCDALLTLSPHLQVTLNRSMKGRLVQLDISTALDRRTHSGLLWSVVYSCWWTVLSIISGFLSNRKQRMRLDGKGSASVDVGSE